MKSTAVHTIKLPAWLGLPFLRGAHRSRGQSTRSCDCVKGTDIPRSPADRAQHPYPAERAYVPKYRLAVDSNYDRCVCWLWNPGWGPSRRWHTTEVGAYGRRGSPKARLDMQAEGLHTLQGQRSGDRLSSESHRTVVEPQLAS